MDISVVSTLYNEEPNVAELVRRVSECAQASCPDSWEIILVNNGSSDGTGRIVTEQCERNNRVKLITLARNFGYQGGILAGIHHATGKWIFLCDGDLQDPPELLPQFLAKAKEGYDIVYGVRKRRKESVIKRIGYWGFYRLWSLMTDIHVPLDAGDFGIFNESVATVLKAFPERLVFLRGLRSWCGFKQTGVPYERQARFAGETKFPFRDMVRLAVDGWTAFSVVPLQLIAMLGFILCGISFALIALILLQWTLSVLHLLPILIPVPGQTQLSVLITFFCGLQMLSLGVIGEYVGRVYLEVKKRPRYLVTGSLNINAASDMSQPLQ